MDPVLLQKALSEFAAAVLYVIFSGTIVGMAAVFLVPADRKTQRRRAGYVFIWGIAALVATEGLILFHWAVWNMIVILSQVSRLSPGV